MCTKVSCYSLAVISVCVNLSFFLFFSTSHITATYEYMNSRGTLLVVFLVLFCRLILMSGPKTDSEGRRSSGAHPYPFWDYKY